MTSGSEFMFHVSGTAYGRSASARSRRSLGGTWNLELGTWNLELGTWNLELGTWNLELRASMKRSLRSWLWRVDVAQEVDEEIAFHIEMRTRELVEKGVEPRIAREMVFARLG